MTKREILPQAPQSVIMIRPHHFTPNPATAADNAFQSVDEKRAAEAIAKAAYDEVTLAVSSLEKAGVEVHLFEDEGTATPDSVFPNNWFSTHAGGSVALYPMYSESRRAERRSDIIEMLKKKYRVYNIIDYSSLEYENIFLEGTGSMVIDHIERVAYGATSKRTDPILLERFCTHFNYEPCSFDAVDGKGQPIYHTNVLMCVGTHYVIIGLDTVADPGRRAEIKKRFESTNRAVIDLTHQQINEFAGNALELSGTNGPVLALSSRSLKAMSADQVKAIEQSATLLPLDIPTIELAGGSVRCMMAGVHLSKRI
jgi:Uncharacterized protein conserved in bacteria containing a pentein-type domain